MSNHDLLALVGGVPTRKPSSTLQLDVLSLRVGASNIPLTDSAGALDVGGARITNIGAPVGSGDVVTKSYVDQQAISGGEVKGAVLINQQLSVSQGVLAAEIFYSTAVAVANDTVVVKNAATTETYTFKASRSVAFEVAVGASAIDSMTNLAAAINSDSSDWSALWVPNNLSNVNAGGVVVVYEKATAAGNSASRIYGTWATQANAKVVEFNGQYEYKLPTTPITLPSSDPAAGRFGYRTQLSALSDGEIHFANADDILYSWNANDSTWFTLSSVIPTATSGSGGGTQGKVSADSDLGLQIISGVMSVKRATSNASNVAAAINLSASGAGVRVDDSTIEADGTNFRLQLKDAGVTAAKLAAATAGAGLTGGAGSAYAVGAADGIKVGADDVAVDYAASFVNDNAGTISIRQIAYVKSNGNIDLANASQSTYDLGTLFVMVEDATIATTSTGKAVTRVGKIQPGFSGLTVGSPIYLSRSSAGGYQQDLTGFVSGDQVISLGRVVSATSIEWNPKLEYIY